MSRFIGTHHHTSATLSTLALLLLLIVGTIAFLEYRDIIDIQALTL